MDIQLRPIRDQVMVITGGSGAKLSAARFAPRVADLYMERTTFDSQGTDIPVYGRADNLYQPVADDGGERGRNWNGHTRETSIYTRAFLHPKAAAALLTAVALIAGAGVATRTRPKAATRERLAS